VNTEYIDPMSREEKNTTVRLQAISFISSAVAPVAWQVKVTTTNSTHGKLYQLILLPTELAGFSRQPSKRLAAMRLLVWFCLEDVWLEDS